MKKLLAVLLSLCLVVGLVPMMALADDAAAAEDTTAASSNWVDRYWEQIAAWEEYHNRPHWGDWWDDYAWASIGDEWYPSFSEALYNATAGDTIVIYGTTDVGNVTLDGISLAGYGTQRVYGNITTEGGVELRNLSIYGDITVDSGYTSVANVSVNSNGYDVVVENSATFEMGYDSGIDYIWAAKTATVTAPGLDRIERDNGYVYTDDVSDYYVAYAGGQYYDNLEDALSAGGTVTLLKDYKVNGSLNVQTKNDLYINSGVTLTVTGTLYLTGEIHNYGTVNAGSVNNKGFGTLYNYVDIDTVPSSADVTVWQRYDGNYGWHDWDRYNWVEMDEWKQTDGEYWLTPGWYYYEVSERGYVGDSGWFEVDNSAVGFTVRLEDDAEYRVYVDTMANGSVTVDPTYAKEGERVYITVKPNSGYTLSSLTVTRPNGSTVKLTEVRDNYFRFEMPGSRVTVDAEFERTTMPFNDVSRSDWFYDAVNYVYFNNLMDGVSSTQFAPNSSTTRAMVVEIIYRMAGSPSVSTTAGFTDVASSAWYADAVNWAARRGIVEGRTATTFDPNAPVTREELATLLYRYAVNSGYDTSVGANTNILSYTDAGSISDYAFDSLQWACGAGIVNGTGNGVLSPQGQATRAQLAAMLMRFCSEYVD